MEQEEFENLIAKLKKRKEENDIKTAMKVADRIPWDQVDDINLLIYAANIYDEGEHYKDAKLILEYAYEVAPVKNRLYFYLALINAKCKELKDAIGFYTDFCSAFPTDNRKLLLQYYIMNAKNASLTQQKRLLSEYLSEEKDEKMTFELALICDKLGEREETLQYCNFIVDFFGVKKNGYGKNALLLKKKYAALTASEKALLAEVTTKSLDTNPDIEYTEPPIFYNDTRLSEDKVNIPVEKVQRLGDANKSLIKEEDEDESLNEKNTPDSISITYTPDEESYVEREKNKMAFMHSGAKSKEKLKELIKELKEEEEINTSEFNKYREKSFKRKGRFNNMNLNETKLHMIIEAHSKEEGIDIAQKELHYIHEVLEETSSIAKASAYNINEKGFVFYESKIKNKDLIIENAGMLKNDALDAIEEYIINKKGSTIFALTDVINNFDKLATDRPNFIKRFDIYSVLSNRPQETLTATKEEIANYKSGKGNVSSDTLSDTSYQDTNSEKENVAKAINNVTSNDTLKSTEHKTEDVTRRDSTADETSLNNTSTLSKKNTLLNIDDFVEECKEYARSIDCSMDGKTITALYEKVESMNDDKIPLTKENAAALIEEAADRAEKPKLFTRPKYDKEDRLILIEEHFNF